MKSVLKEKDKNSCFEKSLDYALDHIIEWAYKEKICAIYLYGSYARNEHNADSDVDLYIQVDAGTEKNVIRELKVLCNPDDYTLPEVEVKIEEGTDSLMKDDLFHRNIRRDGILLWKRE